MQQVAELVRGPNGSLSLRTRLEVEVERMIALLDAMDGDPDLEPWLAENGAGVWDDREGGDDEGEPDVDSEPSLGWGHGATALPLGWSYSLAGATGGDDDA